MRRQRNYKRGNCRRCLRDITTGSKSGYCKSCSVISRGNKKKDFLCLWCGKVFKNYPSRVGVSKFCSLLCRAKSQIGVKLSNERVKKSADGHRGHRSHFWKGGVTPVNRLIRGSFEYDKWRRAVFERDNYTCVWCRQRGGVLNADHIKPFAHFPNLRFVIENGRTLCINCHRKTDTYASRAIKYEFTSQTN